jgi:hypothetical protein
MKYLLKCVGEQTGLWVAAKCVCVTWLTTALHSRLEHTPKTLDTQLPPWGNLSVPQ